MTSEDDPDFPLYSPRLSVLINGQVVPLTNAHPPLIHLVAIKTNAAILRGAFDEIEKIANRHRGMPVPGAMTDLVWIHESKELDQYHDMRIALQTEVERYLPEIEIPVLRDITRAWQWNRPLPDRSQFVAEMQKIEHQANLRAVRMEEADRLAKKPETGEFDPIGKPWAIQIPQSTSLSELLQTTIKVQEHLQQFTAQWASDQPDCPRAYSDSTMLVIPESLESFALRRRREVASLYRQMIRRDALRLWKPGMTVPPQTHEDHERDITDVMVPWIMATIATNAEKAKPASKEQLIADDDLQTAEWFEKHTTVTGDSLRRAVSDGKFLRTVGRKGKKRYSLRDAKSIWGDIML